MLALRALLHEMNGERASALALLAEAVRLAAPGGLVRIFTDLGAALVPLLTELEGRESAPTFVHTILQDWPSMPGPGKLHPPAPAHLSTPVADVGKIDHNIFIEPLTRRETEVLELLAQHLTAYEIAEKLVISENTVRRHRANIYQKLGVNRRRDALTVARKVHLIAGQ
jgi:LuxR family transcriptional regulator, maltose regulon positive regulatory protein